MNPSRNAAAEAPEETVRGAGTGDGRESSAPPDLKPWLDAARSRIAEGGEPTDNGCRLSLGGEAVEFREWRLDALVSCFGDAGPDSVAQREVLFGLAFLLRVQEGLDSGSVTEDSLERHLEAFNGAFERLDAAIDDSVLRGGLVGARNLSRFRDLLISWRTRVEVAVAEVRQAREKAARAAERKPAPRKPPAGMSLQTRISEFSSPASADRETVRAQASRPASSRRTRSFARPRTEARRAGTFPVLYALLALLGLGYWGMVLHAGAVANTEPGLDRTDISRVVPVEGAFSAGHVLYGTIDGSWRDMGHQDRLERFRRLRDMAERAGFEGVVLTDSQGDFAAEWSQGGIPRIWGD